MPAAQLILFGDFELRRAAAKSTDSLGQKDRALIGVLAMRPGMTHTREKLAGLLWSDRGQKQARDSLKHSLTRLRHAFLGVSPQPIAADRHSVRFNATSVSIDVAEFERLLQQGSTEAILMAVETFRGDLLESISIRDAAFQEWLLLERQKLRRRLEEALTSLLAKLMATRNYENAGEVARRLIQFDPLQEVAYRALMQILSGQGQKAQALKLFRELNDRLHRDLGVKPELETAKLHEAIRHRGPTAPANILRPPTTGLETLTDGPVVRESRATKPPIVEESITDSRAPAKTQYTKSGDVSIAYQVSGEGPTDLVYVQGWVSHLEYAWESPDYARFIKRLASISRLIRFDRRGVGLSDRDDGPWTLEQRVDDIRAVLDAAGSEKATLLGSSEGGHMSLMFAATHPERISGLILHGCYAREAWAPDYRFGFTQQFHDASLAELERDWGGPFQLDLCAPSIVSNEAASAWMGAYLRHSASLSAAKAALRLSYSLDVRNLLPSTHVPTLVLHRSGDRWVPVENGRYLAAHIPGCRFVELPGIDHAMWWGQQEPLFREIEQFLVGVVDTAPTDRVLMTILVIDVMDPTVKPSAVAGALWADHARQTGAIVQRELQIFGGEEIGTTGNQYMLAFKGPTRGIQCARAIIHDLDDLGLHPRVGLHTGECERRGGIVSGVALSVAKGIAAKASSNSILVSSTVKDLVIGSGLKFDNQGTYSLQGISGDWSLHRVVD